MTKKQYLDEINAFRNKVCALNKEAEKLAKKGLEVKGNFTSVDFEGDEYEGHDNLGEAFAQSCELEVVASALYHLLDMEGGL